MPIILIDILMVEFDLIDDDNASFTFEKHQIIL